MIFFLRIFFFEFFFIFKHENNALYSYYLRLADKFDFKQRVNMQDNVFKVRK